jgi:hypothetical protein
MIQAISYNVNANSGAFVSLATIGVGGSTAFIRIYPASAVNMIVDAADAAEAATKNSSLADLIILPAGSASIGLHVIGTVDPARCWLRANGGSSTTVSIVWGN